MVGVVAMPEMREDFIKNAINFLKNPKLTETPMSQKVRSMAGACELVDQ